MADVTTSQAPVEASVQLLLAADHPTPDDQLIASTYMQLRAIAAGYFAGQHPSHTLQPTALVHEAILRLVRNHGAGGTTGRWNSRDHFLALAATAMRQILVDHARAKAARKRKPDPGEGGHKKEPATTPAEDFLDLDNAITSLARIDPRAAEVINLRFFAGLTVVQTAQVLGVSDFTVERDSRVAKAYLAERLAGRERGEGTRP